MKKSRSLSDVFQSVRTEYFPRWDRKRTWRVKSSASLLVDGICHMDRRLIVLRHSADWESADVRMTLIHEICHAVVPGGHGQRWQGRMLKAAECAMFRGDLELSRLLKQEVEDYRATPFIQPRDVYARIEQCATEQPNLPFSTVLKFLAEELRMSRRQFLQLFPRANTVHIETLQFVAEIKASKPMGS